MKNVLLEMLNTYDIKNENDRINAMKEILQEIVLCGLSRGGFFDEAAFYGGTALRIFYGLDRFSEDLDFALLKPNKKIDLSKYFPFIEGEVKSYGLNITLSKKEKKQDSNIASAFLKGDALEHILLFSPDNHLQSENKLLKNIKIKFKVDINPPSGALYDLKYKLLPSPHQVRIYGESSLFAGKIHAIICRTWASRTKGRDLYDYIFYLSKNVKVNKTLLVNKLIESKVILQNDRFDINTLKTLLKNKFTEIDYKSAKEDILPFIKDIKSLDIWSSAFFCEITDNLEFEE